jgi:hypothetical protein
MKVDPEATLPIYDDNGVDLTLIRWMMSLTVAERIATLQDSINFAALARESRRARDPHACTDEDR